MDSWAGIEYIWRIVGKKNKAQTEEKKRDALGPYCGKLVASCPWPPEAMVLQIDADSHDEDASWLPESWPEE